jgi:hypothetical protein
MMRWRSSRNFCACWPNKRLFLALVCYYQHPHSLPPNDSCCSFIVCCPPKWPQGRQGRPCPRCTQGNQVFQRGPRSHARGCRRARRCCLCYAWPQGYTLLTKPMGALAHHPARSKCHHRAVLWRPQDHKGCVSRLLIGFLEYLRPPADGVTVAKSIVLKNKFENLGARYVSSGISALRV